MAEVAYPKSDDPAVIEAQKKHRVAKRLAIGKHREGSDHIERNS